MLCGLELLWNIKVVSFSKSSLHAKHRYILLLLSTIYGSDKLSLNISNHSFSAISSSVNFTIWTLSIFSSSVSFPFPFLFSSPLSKPTVYCVHAMHFLFAPCFCCFLENSLGNLLSPHLLHAHCWAFFLSHSFFKHSLHFLSSPICSCLLENITCGFSSLHTLHLAVFF